MSAVNVTELFIYPIKSLGGVSVPEIHFNALGPVDDRRYMLVNQKNRFITQRSHSQLSQFQLSKVPQGWQVTSPSNETIVIEDDASTDQIIKTQVWKTPLQTQVKSKEVSQWFSEQLDEIVQLVELDDLESRYCRVDDHQMPFAFADGFPLLVCNQQSLDQLQSKINVTLSMSRFRPNVVVSMPANTEYEVKELGGSLQRKLLFSEPCVRCNVPAIDPLTSVYQKHIHQQLKAELLRDNKVIFGMNALALNLPHLSVGDEFEIIC